MSENRMLSELQSPKSAGLIATLCKGASITLARFPRVRRGHLPTALKPMDRQHGATATERAVGTDINTEMEVLVEKLRRNGHFYHIITGSGSKQISALGYVDCARELTEQAHKTSLTVDALVHASHSSGTQAGLVAGLAKIQSDIHLPGIGERALQEQLEQMIFDLAQQSALYISFGVQIDHAKVHANCDYVSDGNGLMKNALCMLADTEGLLIDPVYSGESLDGLIDLVRKGAFSNTSNIVLLHTGGSAALFGYPETFDLNGYTNQKTKNDQQGVFLCH